MQEIDQQKLMHYNISILFRFPVSRILLSACSDYFETMFTSQFKERDSAEVSLSEVNANDLYSLITFSFTGKIFPILYSE